MPDESHNADGKHVAYLDPAHCSASRFRALDPDLYVRLSGMATTEPVRSVAGLERCGALPAGTVTFAESLTFNDLQVSDKASRVARRSTWLDAALAATVGCELVLLDPDNGVRATDHTVSRHRNKSEKHAYVDEIKAFLDRGQSVVVYHHADRSALVPDQAQRRMSEIEAGCGVRPLAAVRASAGTVRLFVVIAAPLHRQRLGDRLRALEGSPWASELRVYRMVDDEPIEPTALVERIASSSDPMDQPPTGSLRTRIAAVVRGFRHRVEPKEEHP